MQFIVHPPCLFSLVQQSDDGVNVCATKSRVSQVLEESSLIPGSVTRHWQLEWQQEVAGSLEALTNWVDLVNKVLQTDDALFTWEKWQDGVREWTRLMK